ncbi:MAG: META domain-containing protein [Muribaculum sp.]|nr:META domain-containing protein [Muribaculum sp.]
MRINKFILISAAAVFLTGASGCSIFKPSKNGEGSGKGLQGWIETMKGNSDNSKDEANTTSGRVKKSKENKGNEAAEVKESEAQPTEETKAVNLTGDWAIETVFGKKAVGETAPFIKFVPSEGRIYGNNGCNVINAQYELNVANKSLTFSNLASTMMLCADSNITDREVGEALGAATSFTLDTSQPDQQLKLYNSSGGVVMTLMHRDFHFLDGTWAVEAIDGEKVDIDGMKIALDVEEKYMHGNTGCNIINGELETDMETANSISFSKIGMTRMACPNSGWETRMTMALEEAVTAKKVNEDEIEFIGSNGQQVMLLKRTSPIED